MSSEQWTAIAQNGNEMFKIIKEYLKRRLGEEIEFLEMEYMSQSMDIKYEMKNYSTLNGFVINHETLFNRTEIRRWGYFSEYFRRLVPEARSDSTKCKEKSEKMKSLTENMFGLKPITLEQNWIDIFSNTKKIFDAITQIAMWNDVTVKFDNTETYGEVLICDRLWNEALFKNKTYLQELTEKPKINIKKDIRDTFQETITFFNQLHEFTAYSIQHTSNFANLSHKLLSDIQSKHIMKHFGESMNTLTNNLTSFLDRSTPLQLVDTDSYDSSEWINSLRTNCGICSQYIADKNKKTKQQLNALDVITVFMKAILKDNFQHTAEYEIILHNCINLAFNILTFNLEYTQDYWNTIAYNTQGIINSIQTTSDSMKLLIILEDVPNTSDVLMCNKKWNAALSRNIRRLQIALEYSNIKKPEIKTAISESLHFFTQLSDFTVFSIGNDTTLLQTSTDTLVSVKALLQNPARIQSPWPAIERLAAIVARL